MNSATKLSGSYSFPCLGNSKRPFQNRNHNVRIRFNNINLSYCRCLTTGDSIADHFFSKRTLFSFFKKEKICEPPTILLVSPGKRLNDFRTHVFSGYGPWIRNYEDSKYDYALAAQIACWIFMIFFKTLRTQQVLMDYPFPITLSALQFAIGTVYALLRWALTKSKPKINTSQLATIVPLAIANTLSIIFTNISLASVPALFTYSMKSWSVIISAIYSYLLFGEMPASWIGIIFVLIGATSATITETSFNWTGFLSSMASNFTNLYLKVFSKHPVPKEDEPTLDSFTVGSVVTFMSFIITVPVAFVLEGIKFTPSYVQSVGLNITEIYVAAMLGASAFFIYQMISHRMSQMIPPT